jgi:hypothetical protein
MLPIVGERVWWTDPDEDLCSGEGIVTKVLPSGTVTMTKKDGGEVECLPRELRIMEPREPGITGDHDRTTGQWMTYGAYARSTCQGWFDAGYRMESWNATINDAIAAMGIHEVARMWYAAGARAYAAQAGRTAQTSVS